MWDKKANFSISSTGDSFKWAEFQNLKSLPGLQKIGDCME